MAPSSMITSERYFAITRKSFQLSTKWRQLTEKTKKGLTHLHQSYLTKLAGLQCFDTMEQNRTLWNTDPQFKSSFRYLYSSEYFLIGFLTLS